MHFFKSDHEILPDYITIIQSAKDHEVEMTESINIHKIKPNHMRSFGDDITTS